MKGEIKKLKMGLCWLVAICLLGCSQGGSAPKVIVGQFTGRQTGFYETINLLPAGDFEHSVCFVGSSNFVESGKWTYEPQSGAIIVGPFTSFFEQQSRSIQRQGNHATQAALFILREGNIANRISPSVDFEYILYRTEQTNNPSGGSNVFTPEK